MKLASHLLFLLALIFLGFPRKTSAAPETRVGGTGLDRIPHQTGNPTADAMSDEELLKKRNASTPIKALPPKPSAYGLLELSSILESNGTYALLPKGSILLCPDALRVKWVAQPTGKWISWTDFLTANRNWVQCHEVSAEEITGEKAIPAAVLEKYRKANLVIIATQRGNPVTVLPPPSAAVKR